MKYSSERKEAVLQKMLPPHNRAIAELSREEGISAATLYHWRQQARAEGRLLPDVGASSGWSAKDKFAAVVETAALSEAEVAQYCRRRGLYPEQIRSWREACERANDWDAQQRERQRANDAEQRKRTRELERELARKDRALAETAALLALRKKARAIWGEGEDE